MKYKGKEIIGYLEIINYAKKLKGKERMEFISEFLKTSPHALSNIGYISGYFDKKEARKVQKIFSCSHPIFGRF